MKKELVIVMDAEISNLTTKTAGIKNAWIKEFNEWNWVFGTFIAYDHVKFSKLFAKKFVNKPISRYNFDLGMRRKKVNESWKFLRKKTLILDYLDATTLKVVCPLE
jgi:hypothetical protein